MSEVPKVKHESNGVANKSRRLKRAGNDEATGDTKNVKKKSSIRLGNAIKKEENLATNETMVREVNDSVKKETSNVLHSQKYVGAHVSVAGGLENAPINAAAIGAKSFALFLRSQRQWASKPLSDDTVERFKEECQKHGFSSRVILPHGSYLLNCGSPNSEVLRKTREALTDELQRCEKLGLTLYNFHPGSTCNEITVDECLDRIGETINLAHSQTKFVVTVIENMSRQGHTVGGDFKELRGIIDRVKDKSRIGVCIDTCHAFAAGYDLSTEEGFKVMMKEFESIIGLSYLKALHLNDSKGKLNCHLDRHENIDKGHIKKAGFQRIMHDPRFNNIPMILETPYFGDETYEKEIRLLYSL